MNISLANWKEELLVFRCCAYDSHHGSKQHGLSGLKLQSSTPARGVSSGPSEIILILVAQSESCRSRLVLVQSCSEAESMQVSDYGKRYDRRLTSHSIVISSTRMLLLTEAAKLVVSVNVFHFKPIPPDIEFLSLSQQKCCQAPLAVAKTLASPIVRNVPGLAGLRDPSRFTLVYYSLVDN